MLELTSELAGEHGQVALIEIDFKRKFHTRHGLHFNKQGKLLFSNKITQAIHTMSGKRLQHKIETEEKCDSHEQENQEVTNSESEDKGKEGECSHINGELVILQATQGDNDNSEGKPEQVKQGTTNSDSVNMSEVEKCNQITNRVLDTQDPEDGDEVRAESFDQVKLEDTNSSSNDKSRITDPRTSGRIRKQPVTRGNDFLWTKD